MSPIFSIVIGQYLARNRQPAFLIKAVCICGIISAIVIVYWALKTSGVDGLVNPRDARENTVIGVNAMILVACSIYFDAIIYRKGNEYIIGNKWIGFFYVY